MIDAPCPNDLVMFRTVLVTPTRLLISFPQQEPSNSVTRRYHDRLDVILRVVFTNEEEKLFLSFFGDLADGNVQDDTKQAD